MMTKQAQWEIRKQAALVQFTELVKAAARLPKIDNLDGGMKQLRSSGPKEQGLGAARTFTELNNLTSDPNFPADFNGSENPATRNIMRTMLRGGGLNDAEVKQMLGGANNISRMHPSYLSEMFKILNREQ